MPYWPAVGVSRASQIKPVDIDHVAMKHHRAEPAIEPRRCWTGCHQTDKSETAGIKARVTTGTLTDDRPSGTVGRRGGLARAARTNKRTGGTAG
jgi:hypothetical protein